jgi:hypothetical protein
MEGVDFSYDKDRISATQLYAAGRRFACRYLCYPTKAAKMLTRSEADRLKAAGLDIVSNWEHDAGDMLLGRAGGLDHAQAAKELHVECGGPSTAPIFFSADKDYSSTQLETCWKYVEACIEELGVNRVGTYGGVKSIRFFADRGVKWLWQTYAWSGVPTVWDSRAHIQQYKNSQTLAGGAVDFDRSMKDQYGSWGAHGASAGGVLLPSYGQSGAHVSYWQNILDYVFRPLTVDGNYKDATKAAIHDWHAAYLIKHGSTRTPVTGSSLPHNVALELQLEYLEKRMLNRRTFWEGS